MTNAVLAQTRGLSLWAGERCLVQRLDWRVQRGERWCVIGRNAVGKSTLLRALAGLSVARREGEIEWLGRAQRQWAPADAAAVRAFMPQQSSDRFALSVERLMELSVAVPGRRSAQEMLARLDAQDLVHRSVLELSGGERQRVALAQCALQGAPLLLLDEPVAFQDPAHQQQVAHWLGAEFAADALVVTAHDVNWIARVATHVLALYGDGRWQLGPATELIERRTLEAVYGCAWRQAGGAWLAA